MRIVASIPICEEDVGYLPSLFTEIERMDVDASWVMNNCSPETVERIRSFSRTVWQREFNVSFHNCLRNFSLEAVELSYDWLIQWDADETWEPDAPEKIRKMLSQKGNYGLVPVRMAHAWDKDGETYFTTDWAAERDRIYNMDKRYRWRYLNRVTAGPTNLYGGDERPKDPLNLWMLHWGYQTKEKRDFHKKRWDKLHGISMGKNPYGQWSTITQAGYEPHLIDYKTLIKNI
jgi:hypothetical protein